MKLNTFLIGVAIIFSCMQSQAEENKKEITIGAHLASYHDRGNYNNNNPGLYVRYNDFVVGSYYNSMKKQSTYFGYNFEINTPGLPLVDSVGILVGGVTGYLKETQIVGFTPMFIPSAKFLVTDYTGFRVAFLPKFKMNKANVFHLSFEKNF